MAKRIIRWPTLKEKLGGTSNVSVWRWERDGIFPKRIKIGPNATGWIESEIDEWIDKKASER